MHERACSSEKKIIILLSLAVLINLTFWFYARNIQAEWSNVPPAPKEKYADIFGIGDEQFAYRIIGLMIQNMGDSGGRATALKEYNYENLASWFYAEDYLDPKANFVPYLAAYYFSALQEPEKFRPVLKYLREVGMRSESDKWRFLVQAVVIAHKYIKDHDTAISLAEDLANHPKKDIPVFTKQMKAFILNDKGDKDLAYAVMFEILKERGDKLDPFEVKQMTYNICRQILSLEDAKENPLCYNVPLGAR